LRNTEESLTTTDSTNSAQRADKLARFNSLYVDTAALGVWAISFAGMVITTLIYSYGCASIYDSGSTFWDLISTSLSIWCITVGAWHTLSWFKWPRTIKLLISFWAAVMVIGLPFLTTIYNCTGFSWSWLLQLPVIHAIFLHCALPSTVFGLASLFPYFYYDYLRDVKPELFDFQKAVLEEKLLR